MSGKTEHASTQVLFQGLSIGNYATTSVQPGTFGGWSMTGFTPVRDFNTGTANANYVALRLATLIHDLQSKKLIG
jgi:hypothetical protein